MDEALEWLEQPTLSDPLALIAFEGWNDAGDAASRAVGYVLEATGARLIAVIDHDEFNDHQVSRPYISIDDGGERVIEWPDTRFYVTTAVERPLVLVLGEEPRLRWKRFCQIIVDALNTLSVDNAVTMGAFLGQVPHTLDVPVIGSYDRPTRQTFGLLPSRYEGPTGIIGILNTVLRRAGLEAGSLWAATPHYLQTNANPKATRALLQKVELIGGVQFDLGELDVEVAEWEARVAAAVAGDDELAGYLREMEDLLAGAEADNDDGDGLVEEIERFLRNQ